MLVLLRGVGDRVWVAPDCMITVCDVDRRTGRVKLGFEAPKHVAVMRAELIEATCGHCKRPIADPEEGDLCQACTTLMGE